MSLNFDDGYESAYKLGIPVVEAAGFKSTNYIFISGIGDPGYMGLDEIRDLQRRGHEIGAHSRTHRRLTEISLEEAREEIFGSKEDLQDKGIVRLVTFSYPEGFWNKNIIELVKEAGFTGARITNPGLNDKETNPYELYYFGMNASTTFETVKQKVDEAVREKKWLIMVFHKIDESGFENVSSDLLQKTVDLVGEKQIPVVTNAQGLFVLENIPH